MSRWLLLLSFSRIRLQRSGGKASLFLCPKLPLYLLLGRKEAAAAMWGGFEGGGSKGRRDADEKAERSITSGSQLVVRRERHVGDGGECTRRWAPTCRPLACPLFPGQECQSISFHQRPGSLQKSPTHPEERSGRLATSSVGPIVLPPRPPSTNYI